MKKTFLLCLFVFWIQSSWAATYFVDSTTGNDGDSGATMDLAWATIEHAVEAGVLSAGDYVWVRRIHVEYSGAPTSDIVPEYDGTPAAPIHVIGWPRSALAGTADATNGYRYFYDLSITADREKHQGRYIQIDADGYNYLITDIGYWVTYDGQDAGGAISVSDTVTTDGGFSGIVTDIVDDGDTGTIWFRGDYTGTITDNDELKVSAVKKADASMNGEAMFIIDRPFAGTTANDGACTLAADEDWYDDMGTQYGFDDSGWTIKEAAWDADAIDLPCIDFQDAGHGVVNGSKMNWYWANLELKDSTDSSGPFYAHTNSEMTYLIGCLFHQGSGSNQEIITLQAVALLDRCILEGTGQTRHCITGQSITMKNCAVYGCYNCFELVGMCFLENVNLGIEIPSVDEDVEIIRGATIIGKDVNLGGAAGYVLFSYPGLLQNLYCSIENFQKTQGYHWKITPQGAIGKITAGDTGFDSDVPNQRSGGSANLICVKFDNSSSTTGFPQPIDEWMISPIFVHEFEVDTTSRSYQYYVQSMGALSSGQLKLVVEYIGQYDGSDEYVTTYTEFTGAITARDDVDDWDQYIEATGIQPAIASKVRIKAFSNYYHATNKFYIDPKVVIY